MLRDETLTRFRDAVRARLDGREDGCGDGARHLTAAVQAAVRDARDAHASVEEVIARLKAEWDAVVLHEGARARMEALGLRDGIISTAIEAYYVQ